MGLKEIRAALIKKGYSKVSLDKKTEPKPKKTPATEPKNKPEVELKEDEGKAYEKGCNKCGETPEDCKCDDCDCEK